jgi:hypothetical protein
MDTIDLNQFLNKSVKLTVKDAYKYWHYTATIVNCGSNFFTFIDKFGGRYCYSIDSLKKIELLGDTHIIEKNETNEMGT